MKVLSLFSGAGGLDLGLIQAGNTVVWANDIDENAVKTYKKNIGEHIVLGDIKNIDIKKLPKADVVVGGFPCQGFSQANRFRMLDDERNTLYKFFYEVIHEKQPKFFIAENVKGILSLGKGEAIKQIISDFPCSGKSSFLFQAVFQWNTFPDLPVLYYEKLLCAGRAYIHFPLNLQSL